MKLLTWKHDNIRSLFPGWDSAPVEDREEIRDLLANRKHSWAKTILSQKYGLDSDSDYGDSNSRLSDR